MGDYHGEVEYICRSLSAHLDGERIQSCYYVTMIKRIQRFIIVGGGDISNIAFVAVRPGDYVIGVDRGAHWLVTNKIIPDIAIGDFDSVSEREFGVIKQRAKRIEKYPKEKDFTDTELAVNYAIKHRPIEVIIYGALGGRLDHAVGNLHLLERLVGVGVIRDERSEVRVIDGKMTLRKDPRYRYVSLIALSEKAEVSLVGFHYDGARLIIRRGQTRGISNEIKGNKAMITVRRGRVLVIRSRD